MIIQTTPVHLTERMELARTQLGDAFGSFGALDVTQGIATINLHPRASKYARMAIEASGFIILKEAA